MRLTSANIRTVQLPPGIIDKVYFDEDLPGFGLRVRASGVHSWMVQYAIAGHTRRITLGLLTALDPSRARGIAQELLARVRLGHDPAAEKAAARVRATETFGALLPRFLERQKKRLKPRSYEATERHLTARGRALHGQPIESITRRTIAGVLDLVERKHGPTSRNRVRASLSAYFTWLAREGYIETNPVTFTNFAEENGARERTLSDMELRAIWQGLDGASPRSPDYPAILKLLMLTGARRNEIADLRWNEIVDLHGTMIMLPPERTKNNREHLIPLSEPALQLLKALPRRTMADGAPREHVFGHRGTERGFQGWNPAKRELDARITKAGHALGHWTLHDFRRSLSTTLHERFKVPPHVVEVMLGHVGGHKGGVAGVYNKALYLDERRRALERWGAHIMSLADGTPGKAKVVRLRRTIAAE
jgi:integrase